MAQLHVKYVQFGTLVARDSSSGAREDLCTWKPFLESGWFYLGPSANNGGPNGGFGIVVKPVHGTSAIVPITRWNRVWCDAGSGKRVDFALWEGLPAVEHMIDYTVVGGFFTRYSNRNPAGEDTRGMVAVHKDCLTKVDIGRRIWTDEGTGARQNGSVWGISAAGHLQGIVTGGFLSADGHHDPPKNTYALARNRIVPVPNPVTVPVPVPAPVSATVPVLGGNQVHEAPNIVSS